MWNYWVDNFNKRMCKYLIQRYLGQYLQDKLSLDQLTVDLSSGRGIVTNVTLDCDALNTLAEEQSIPIEFLEGSLESISLSIPWKTILNDSCEVEISGLYIAVQPKKRVETSTSMLDSMWTSMVSSIQLAKECLQTSDSEDEKEPAEENSSNSLPGLEDCAKAIDAVFSRGKVCFRNSTIRVERVQVGGTIGIALELHIKLWNYADEACIEGTENEAYETAFSVKRINVEGVTCYSDLFPADKYSSLPTSSDPGATCSGEENAVMLGKLNGRHTISIKIKEDESIHAPQITIDCKFGSLLAFLSPTQAHILMSLISDLLNPDPATDKLPSKNLKQKPMDQFDFKRVERELQEQIKPGGIGLSGLQRQQGWSSPGLDDSDEEFLPLKSKSGAGGLFNSVHSNLMDASMTSVTSSVNGSVDESVYSVPSSTKTNLYYSSGSPKKMFGVQSSHIEKTNFSISLTSAVIVLLHEDVIILSSSRALEADSAERMRKYSQDFFKSLGMFSATGKRNASMNNQLNTACILNHSRLIAAPLKISGCITTSDSTPTTMGYVAFGFSEVVEYINETPGKIDPTIVPVLSFNNTMDHYPSESFRLDFKVRSYKNKSSKTSLKIHLQPCSSELDISQFDRLNALFYPKLLFYTRNADLLEFGNSPSTQSSWVLLKLTCESMAMNFRFPIPDLRGDGDLEKIPFSVRNLRNDSVVLNLKELKFTTSISSSHDTLEFDTSCEEVNLSYKQSQDSEPVHFANAGRGSLEPDGVSITTQGFDKPRVVVTISPRLPTDNQTNQNLQEEDPVSFEAFMPQTPKTISPFTSKRVVHECYSSQEDLNANAESVIPGDRKEMLNFMSIAARDVVYQIELQLHTVNVSLPSKHFFEEIYNRLSNDLLLWEPYIPKQFISSIKSKIFHEFKSSGFADGSGSEDDEEEISAFYTPSITTNFQRRSLQNKQANGQSEVTLSLIIRDGTLSFFTPFTGTTGSVVPGQKGQITFKVQQGNLFLVSGFEGNPNLGFICIRVQEAEFYHTDLISKDITDSPKLGDHLKRTIYPSDEGVLAKGYSNSSNTSEYFDMLSVAIKIDRDAVKRVKTFKVATAIKEGTLSHKVWLPNRSWFTQLLDFFDVTDVPVLGYTPSSVVTELHLHLWDCAVDYQPANLSTRSILAIGNFSLSSNIVAQTNTSVIRIMAEDTAFYLTTCLNSTILQQDYVCVLDMDLFELSLRLCQSRTSTAPKIEMTATNNVLHIRTCNDSFKLLLDLLTYYANDGDLTSFDSEINEDCSHSSPIRDSPNEAALIDTEESWEKDRVMSSSQTEHVHDLVADAMVDNEDSETSSSSAKPKSLSPNSRGNLELHFEDDGYNNINFCTNNSNGHIPSDPKYFEPVMQSSDGLPVDISLSDDDDEAFCILENDPGVGIPSKSGEPEARVLTDEPIRIIENYFAVPIGRTDILKAPKHYPTAVAKYALQEMSVVWHLFGGEDFPLPISKRNKESKENLSECDSGKVDPNFAYMYDQNEVDIGLDALNTGVVFSKTKAFESAWEAYESPKSSRKLPPDAVKNSRNRGGKGRKNDVCIELHLAKIKFQHEIYPENREQASRQVLVINTVEIRDRLISSQFNKMLYLYSSPSRPRQSHANMVVIKAAHLRPDPHLNIEECCLKISLLPLRVNVDQDALLFLYQFFSEICQKPEAEEDAEVGKPFSHTPSVESLPVMTVKNPEFDEEIEIKEESENLLIFDESPIQDDSVSTVSKDHSIDSSKSNMPVYFKQVIFSPDVPIRIDYMGKRLDMTHGPLAGILMCLGQLNCSEIQLKRLNYRNGILGVDKLIAYMVTEWGTDIKKNQLPSLLGGIGPLYSFVQIFQGVRDLFWLPIEQYQKDGRIAKGLQRGASAFSTSAAMAALELTNRLVQTIQGVAEFTYDMVSPGPSVQQQRKQSTRKKRHPQPNDIREGVANAYNVVRDGLGDTAKTIVRVASKEHEQKGISGAVGGVLRQLAPTVCVPIILSTQATSSVLDGFKSQLEPESRKEAAEKWKEN